MDFELTKQQQMMKKLFAEFAEKEVKERQVKKMRKAYVVAAKRSAIGSFLGGLTNVKPVDLGATVLINK